MPGSKSLYLENAVLDHVLGGVIWTPPTILYLALSSAAYDENAANGSAFNELSGLGYARVALNNDPTSWPAAVNGQKTNGVTITFPTATNTWVPVLSAYILDAMTAGNILYGGDLAASRTLQPGDTASFGPGGITVNED